MSGLRVEVDPDFCGGHGACAVTCPEVFVVGPDGWAMVLVDEVPESLEAVARQAVEECPTQAISIAGDDSAADDIAGDDIAADD